MLLKSVAPNCGMSECDDPFFLMPQGFATRTEQQARPGTVGWSLSPSMLFHVELYPGSCTAVGRSRGSTLNPGTLSSWLNTSLLLFELVCVCCFNSPLTPLIVRFVTRLSFSGLTDSAPCPARAAVFCLLASSCLSLTSYSLLGGSFGRLDGSHANGSFVKKSL